MVFLFGVHIRWTDWLVVSIQYYSGLHMQTRRSIPAIYDIQSSGVAMPYNNPNPTGPRNLKPVEADVGAVRDVIHVTEIQ